MTASTFCCAVFFMTSVSYSISYFNCEKGIYESMSNIVQECQKTSYAPNLRTFRKTNVQISGPALAEMMEKYCLLSDKIFRCGKAMVEFIPCLSHHGVSYETMVNKSHWFCSGLELKNDIRDIFKGLPLETLDYKSNVCYRSAPAKTYECLRRYLDTVSRHTGLRETTRRILASLRCSFRTMMKVCSRDTSLVLVLLEYDWLIIPPALGFNISDILITLSQL
nr:hypothetical protein BgiMline_023887 [Biomphalaria glabrata]